MEILPLRNGNGKENLTRFEKLETPNQLGEVHGAGLCLEVT